MLEQFAREQAAKVKLVGLGTQDDLAQAKAFVSRHGLTFPMLWEEDFESWQGFGITRQPAAVLVDTTGKELARYRGEMSEADRAEILRLVEAA